MKTMIWTSQLSVGNVVIDAEHRKMMCLVNNTIYAIQTKDSLTLLHELEYLEKWLHAHFANEEKLARALNFPCDRLKPAQQSSLGVLHRLRDELEAEYGIWSAASIAHFSCFLKRWMIGHITLVDMPMKHLLQEHDYNFWPGYIAQHAARTATAAGQQARAHVENNAGAMAIRLLSCSQTPLPQSPEAGLA